MRPRVGSLPLRAALLAGVLLALWPPAARAERQLLCVVVVPGLELADLEPLAGEAALGLLVPGAGPRVSEESALAALERGQVRNSLRGGLPSGPVLIAVGTAPALPSCRPAIVLGLPEGGDQPNDRRYPVAVAADGYRGVLTSPSTRIPGVVSVADVAPAALGAEGALSSREEADPFGALEALDARIRDNVRSRPLAALMAGLVVLVFSAAWPRAALLGFAAALGANLVLGVAGASSPWLVLLATGLAVVGGAPLLALVARTPLALAGVLAVVLGGYLAALGLDGTAVALSPFGPQQNGRYYGLSNLLSAFLLVPALAAPALLLRRAGWLAAGLAAALALVTITGSRFGADGGTAVVLVLAYAVLAVELAEARRRLVAVAAGAVAAAVAALVAIDAVTGAASHLTDAVGGGPSGFAADLRDRAVLSWERATEHWYVTVLVAAGGALLAAFALRLVLLGVPRATRALPLAMAVATGASLVVNDSPLDVVSVGLLGYLALQSYALAELGPGDGRPPREPYRRDET